MSVYKEGYKILENYLDSEVRIGDFEIGVWTKKDDENWNQIKQLVSTYGQTNSKLKTSTGDFVSIVVILIDEWAVSDERKTIKEATEQYIVTYQQMDNAEGYDGYFTINKN